MPTAPTPAPDDPYLWLEAVDGERALAWVRERNRGAEAQLAADPAFDTRRRLVREVLDSKAQIPTVKRLGQHLYNLWRDAEHPRGLWRRTTLAGYRLAEPPWQTVLDLDALGRAEGENWVWGGATCFGPAYRRCLLRLSRGGADAAVVREFDTVALAFVAPADGGFVLPEAKSQVDWLDADTLLVGTDTGTGSMTASGYPRTVRRWSRGQPLAASSVVFEGRDSDVSVFAGVDRRPGFERVVVGRAVDFYRTELFRWRDGRPPARIDKPDDAQVDFWGPRALVTLRSDWRVGDRVWPKGSLLAGDAALLGGGNAVAPGPGAGTDTALSPSTAPPPAANIDRPAPSAAPGFTALFTPTATRSLAGFTTTRDSVVVDVLDDVASRLEEWTPTAAGWQRREVDTGAPGHLATASLHDPLLPDDPLADAYLVTAAGFLQPDTLALARTGGGARETLKSRPRFFDSDGMRVEQRFARSKDGTRVPYFVVWPAGAKADGDNPTLLYGYGGFEVSLTPWYSGAAGRLWARDGGVYVVANIRGGGEYGPAWHQAAVGADKPRSHEDFIAVAEDLVATGVTRPSRLGIQGGSNGGLLVGAVMVQRPDLFGAVVCQVPLLDMLRYHRLLAGASWVAEYGDPEVAAERDALLRWSPYQNVRPGVAMPPVLFTTSTRDDRVHPGHARKMAARMLEQGHAVLYWENIEGGHGGAADNAQRAQMVALEYTFLWQRLGRR